MINTQPPPTAEGRPPLTLIGTTTTTKPDFISEVSTPENDCIVFLSQQTTCKHCEGVYTHPVGYARMKVDLESELKTQEFMVLAPQYQTTNFTTVHDITLCTDIPFCRACQGRHEPQYTINPLMVLRQIWAEEEKQAEEDKEFRTAKLEIEKKKRERQRQMNVSKGQIRKAGKGRRIGGKEKLDRVVGFTDDEL